MPRRLVPLLLLGLLLPVSAPAQGVFGALEQPAAAAGARRALVIGIDAYEDPAFPALRFARRDAEELAAVLEDPTYGGFASVERVTGGELDARAVVARLTAWAASLSPDDLAFVYFSGHGTRLVDERNRSQVFLAARDSRRDSPLETALPLQAMQEFMESLPTPRRVLVVDACFTGDGKVDAEDAEAAARARIDEKAPYKDGTTGEDAQLFATTYGRPALESRTREHGLYTFHFIGALKEHFDAADVNADRVVAVSEAHDWARDRTLEESAEAQVPMAFYKIVGREQLVLSGDPEARLRARLAMITSYRGPQQGLVLELDGEQKGAFPRTVLVDPGPHVVTFRNLKGKVVDQGRVRLKPEGVYSVEKLRDELNGGRHILSFGYAHTWLPGAQGLADVADQAFGGRIGYTFRFPSRDPFVRRLGVAADLVVGGFPQTEAGAEPTVLLELGVGPVLRLDLPFVLLSVQPRFALSNLLRTGEAERLNWLFGTIGAELGAGFRPLNRLSFTVRWQPMFYTAALAGPTPKLAVMQRLIGAVEVGF